MEGLFQCVRGHGGEERSDRDNPRQPQQQPRQQQQQHRQHPPFNGTVYHTVDMRNPRGGVGGVGGSSTLPAGYHTAGGGFRVRTHSTRSAASSSSNSRSSNGGGGGLLKTPHWGSSLSVNEAGNGPEAG